MGRWLGLSGFVGCLQISGRLNAGSVGKRDLMHSVCFQVDGMSPVSEDGNTNTLYVIFLISYVVIINWILLQVAPNPRMSNNSKRMSIKSA